MHVFFEDDGAFKAGTVLADNSTSLQVETTSGKRLKIKTANVLLRFAEPSPPALLAQAQVLAATLDPDFLWEVSDGREFAFTDLASEYYGHAPAPAEAAALAICLHAAPAHFYKKGKGRYRAAPVDALQAALAGAERKRPTSERRTATTATGPPAAVLLNRTVQEKSGGGVMARIIDEWVSHMARRDLDPGIPGRPMGAAASRSGHRAEQGLTIHR